MLWKHQVIINVPESGDINVYTDLLMGAILKHEMIFWKRNKTEKYTKEVYEHNTYG